MNPASVLLIDDDEELTGLLRDYLAADGFAVRVAATGEAGVAALGQWPLDIVVLDVMMPGISGIETLRRIRALPAARHLPVIMLTARGDDTERIFGLELGADDYVAKPCTPRELAARLRAILRRTGHIAAGRNGAEAPFLAGQLGIDPGQRRVEWDGQPVDLTSTEYDLLATLARHAGQPVSKADLCQEALQRPLGRYDRSIDVHFSSIRRKLGCLPDGRSVIQTVHKRGYQLILY